MNKEVVMKKSFSFWLLIGTTVLFGVLLYHVIRPLVLPLFLAAVVAILLHPQYRRFTHWLGGHVSLSAGTLTFVALLTIVLPLGLLCYLGYAELHETIIRLKAGQQVSTSEGSLERVIHEISRFTKISTDEVRVWVIKAGTEIEEVLYYRTVGFLGEIPGLILGFILFILSLFFFLKDGEQIIHSWDELTPFEKEYDLVIRQEFTQVCRGVVWGTLLAAVVQATTFGLGLFVIDWYFQTGITGWVFLLTIVTLVSATIPFLGAFAVWAPTAAILFFHGHTGASVALCLFGAAIVSQVDTIVRIWVLQSTARLHPLLVFVCVFGGIQFLGVLGVFVGPIIGAIMLTLLRLIKSQVTGKQL